MFTFHIVTKPEGYTEELHRKLTDSILGRYLPDFEVSLDLLRLNQNEALQKKYGPFQGTWIVAKDSKTGEIAGAVNFYLLDQRKRLPKESEYAGTCHEVYIFVDPKYRGSCLAKLLLEHMEKTASEYVDNKEMLTIAEITDPDKLSLKEFLWHSTRNINLSNQIKKYLQLGYVEIGGIEYTLPPMSGDYDGNLDKTCMLMVRLPKGKPLPLGKLLANDIEHYIKVLYTCGEEKDILETLYGQIRELEQQKLVKIISTNVPDWNELKDLAEQERKQPKPGLNVTMGELREHYLPQRAMWPKIKGREQQYRPQEP